jgi:hypothetical protein
MNLCLFTHIVRKEYEKRAELRRIRGMRVADFLAEHDNPAEHYMATDTPVREGGPKRIEQATFFMRIRICRSVLMNYESGVYRTFSVF